jgi:uncharacterized membrane protein AbrB (regulator of aidB expression)
MLHPALLRRGVARAIIVLQVLPILALRPAAYSLSSQEWWLPALLAALAVVAAVQVLSRGTHAPWPWHLFSFAQGFSIISKLMMFMPHATIVVNGVQRLDVVHLVFSLVSMAISACLIWYFEQTEVRNLFLASAPGRQAARPKSN